MSIAYGLSFSALIFAPPLTPWLAYGIAADCMHFIMKGRVAIIVHLRNGRTLRVRSLGFHTTIGERSLIRQWARSATIKAEADSVLYALSLGAYQRIARENPDLNRALLT
jgi:SulP family sulfate permease